MRLNYEKIFKVFLLLFTCSLFIPFDTFAAEVSNWAGTAVRNNNTNLGGVNRGSPYDWYPTAVYPSCGNPTSLCTLPTFYVQTTSLQNKCSGNNTTASGTIWIQNAPSGFTLNNNVLGQVQMHNSSTGTTNTCTYTIVNNVYINFSCTGNYNSGTSTLWVNGRGNYYSTNNMYLNISNKLTYSCNDGGSTAIIENNNINTNKIIENNNSNTNRIVEQQEETNNILKNEDAPNSNGFFNEVNALLDESPITNLVTLPLTLINAYISGFSSSCSAFTLGTLYDHTLTLPCINPPDYIGNTLWLTIDGVTCIIIIYNIILMCIGIFESITSLDDTMQYLYTPKHGDLSREGRGHSRGDY